MPKKNAVEENVTEENVTEPTEYDLIIAAAKAEAKAIIDAAKATKPKAARAAKAKAPEVVLTPEEIEAAAVLAEEKRLRIEKLEADLATHTANVLAVKAELAELKGKRTSGTTNRGPVGVGAFVKELITEGKTNQEILDAVAVAWPDNTTNVNCINWYRNALKNWPDGKRPAKARSVEDVVDAPDEEVTADADFQPEFAEE